MSKKNNLYSIFRIYDYKGGEGRLEANLTAMDVAYELVESSYHDLIDKESELSDEQLLLEIEEGFEDRERFSLYAGGKGFTGIIVKHKNGLIHEIEPKRFRKLIMKIIRTYYD